MKIFKEMITTVSRMATYTYEGKEYLKCSKCFWPRIEATEENIAEHYGYNRFLQPYRTCKNVE